MAREEEYREYQCLELITFMIGAIGSPTLEESRDFHGQVNGNIIIAAGRYSL